MFSDFFNNKTTVVTIFIIVLLILFFVFSFAIVLIQEKIEDTVYTTKERLRKTAVLLIGSTVNVILAWFIYSWMIKPRLDRMLETGSSFNNNEDNLIEQNSEYNVPNVEEDPTYEKVSSVEQVPIPSNENNYTGKISDTPAFNNENTDETFEFENTN